MLKDDADTDPEMVKSVHTAPYQNALKLKPHQICRVHRQVKTGQTVH